MVTHIVAELLSSHRAALALSAESTGKFCAGFQDAIDSQSDAFAASVHELQSNVHEHKSIHEATVLSSVERMDINYLAVKDNWQATNSLKGTLEGQMNDMNINLVSSLSNVKLNVDTSCEESAEILNSANADASRILSDVGSASSAMNKEVSQSLDSLVVCLDSHGENSKENALQFFNDLETGFSYQKELILPLEKKGISFEKATKESRLKPRGSTPTKAPFKGFNNLPSTRDHAVIMEEAKITLREGNRLPLSELNVNQVSGGNVEEPQTFPLNFNQMKQEPESAQGHESLYLGDDNALSSIPEVKKPSRPRSSSRLRFPTARTLNTT